MTRRKTRPFTLQDIMSNFHSSQDSENNTESSSVCINNSSQPTAQSSQSSVHHSQFLIGNTLGESKGQCSGQVINSQKPDADNVRLACPVPMTTSSDSRGIILDKGNSKTSSHIILNPAEVESKAQDTSLPTMHAARGPGYLANRRSAAFAICQDEYAKGQSATVGENLCGTGLKTNTPSALKRTLSTIRLSTSIDGKARVTTSNESLPEAPKLADTATKPRVRAGLQRSQSAIESTNPSLAFARRSMTGRSRDARTWEFYCDSDAGNALIQQAEREQSGSAIGPIGLIRSHSNKVMAQTNKRNANASKHEPTKRQKSDGQLTDKPKLGRVMSSVARLQSVTGNMQKQPAKVKEKGLKPHPQLEEDDYYSGDSDKENWEPGTRRRHIGRVANLQASGHRRRAVLEENDRIPSQSSSLDILMNRENVTPRPSRPKSNETSAQKPITLAVDEEVTAFIGGADEPREGSEDLDCVQSLLSLSQAAWE